MLFDKLQMAAKSMANPPLDSAANTGRFQYKYASLAAILGIVRPALLAQGLFLSQGIKTENGSMVLETTIYDGEGEACTLDRRLVFENANAQQFGSFETYMRRYALCSVFGLVGEEDDDGAKTTKEAPQAVNKAEAQQAQDVATQAARELSDAITVYCAATNATPANVRKTIQDKLHMNGEGGDPSALKREAENLHLALKALKLDGGNEPV